MTYLSLMMHMTGAVNFGIDHVDIFIPFDTEGSTVFFDSYVPTEHELDTCPYITLTSNQEWNPQGIETSRNCPYGDNASATVQSVHCVLEKRKRSPIEYESDLVLGSISGSFVTEMAYERLVSSVRVEYPRSKRTDKQITAHGKGRSIRKIVANTRHSVITPEHLARMLNIGLDKAKLMLHVTTQKGIRTQYIQSTVGTE